MQNNQEATTQEQQKSQEVKEENRLCEICHKFFGTAKTNFYCSKCFKTLSEVTQQQQQQQQQQIVEEKQQTNQQAQVQEDSSKCKVCRRKLGIAGIQCKCNAYFCSKHRLPEEHQCTFDHAENAKKQLIKNNPLVDHEKIEKL